MNELLVIVGPTGAGKTALALHLSKVVGGEVISADSRQVYQGMDIGTGKDLPKGEKILGYDLITPKEKFSVADYVRFAKPAIDEVLKKNRLPILVGGTGLYIKAVVDGIETVHIPKNEQLRNNLAAKTPAELFEMLAEIDPTKAAAMNLSDKKNPRRLVRAIEIAQYKLDKPLVPNQFTGDKYNVFFVGLTAPREELNKRIERRVDERVAVGMEEEINKLLATGLSWSDQAMTSLGYRQWKDYFSGKKSKEQVIDEWKTEEKKYAKRQMTWFKKDKRIKWFDITKTGWEKKVEKLVKKWYN